jgi:hypothetical protein
VCSSDLEGALGAPIYVSADYETGAITVILQPSVTSRGVYDYQRMAYLANNQLLTALLSVFPVRDALYMLGALLVFSSLLIGIIRGKQYGEKGGN